MPRLTKEQLLSQTKLPTAEVEIPEWGGSVVIRGLTVAKQNHIRKSAMVGAEIDAEKLQTLMIVHCVVEPELTEGDIETIRQLPAATVNKLSGEIMKVCGLSSDAAKEERQAMFQGNS